MSNPKNTTTSARHYISIVSMLVLLGIFLSLYFLKYVPEHKRDYNQRAFRELRTVTDAFEARANSYLQIPIASAKNKEIRKKLVRNASKASDSADVIIQDATKAWGLKYAQGFKPIDSILLPLTAGDNDVFDHYLMILGLPNPKDTIEPKNGQLIFNPEHLSIGFSIDVDTLLKKTDGFSMMNIRDVKVEGNDYKLFYYPFCLQNHKIIMAGLLSQSRYTARYESVPVNFITTGAILLVLILVAIPLLKVYIIGSHERITTLDLRLIIGTYYIGGFVLYFLILWNFLGGSQTARNHRSLTYFTRQLDSAFDDEIRLACRQLKHYDRLYQSDSLLKRRLDSAQYNPNGLDSLHPNIYKQFKDIFWIDSQGNWVGRYAFMYYDTLPLIRAGDRQYFKDMKAGNVLRLKDNNTPFCLQPTLGRLDGTFAVNIVIPTDTPKRQKPIMVGMFTEMYSVCNTVLPPGYGFSIIDGKGDILFDSRERSRLTNIYPDLSEIDVIENCVRNRQVQFFSSTQLHGTNVAMLTTPAESLPYTLLAWYELDRDQQFQLHVLGLFCLFIGGIIILLILSAYCNEWISSRTTLVAISTVSFEWIRPVPGRAGYYRHFIKGIALLASCYCIPWLIFQLIGEPFGFYLFATSLLFPFYLTVHYVLLREKQKPTIKRLSKKELAGSIGLPLLVIITVLIYLVPDKFPPENILPTLLTQGIFILAIWHSVRTFRPGTIVATRETTLKLFDQAVVAGILLTVIVPASGIFSFFYKEETLARARSEKLVIAGLIANRADSIKATVRNYSFRYDNQDRIFLRELRNKKGIYIPDSSLLGGIDPASKSSASPTPGLFGLLHDLLFAGDTTVVLPSGPWEVANDGSWAFARQRNAETLIRPYTWGNETDTIRLQVLPGPPRSALAMVFDASKSQGLVSFLLLLLIMLLGIGLLYGLTDSLIRRIFLLRLFDQYPGNLCQNEALMNAQTTLAGIKLKSQLQALTLAWSAPNIREYEESNFDYRVLRLQDELGEVYQRIWNDLSPREQFVLYDFAIDNLANYKSGTPLHNLIQKGILCLGNNMQLHFMTHSFHNFVLNQGDNEAVVKQMKRAREQGSWQNVKTPLLLILTAVGIFIFLTQETIYQKITGLFTSLGSLVPLIQRFLGGKGEK